MADEATHEETKAAAQIIAETIDELCPEDLGFALMLFERDSGWSSFASNMYPKDAPGFLRRLADGLEKKGGDGGE